MAIDYQNSSRDEAIVLAGVAGLLGLGLVLLGMNKGGTGGQQHHPRPDETFGALSAPGLTSNGQMPISLGTPIVLNNPTVPYKGNGRTAYAYFQLKQQGVTVYGSGIPIMPLPSSPTLQPMPLVPANECQCQGNDPCGSTGPQLTAYEWDGIDPCGMNSVPICGRRPVAGPADAYLELYEDQNESGYPNDGLGYTPSPTCSTPPRTPLLATKFPNAFVFV